MGELRAGSGDGPLAAVTEGAVDARAVRVALAAGSAHVGLEPIVVGPEESDTPADRAVLSIPAAEGARAVRADAARLDRYDAVHGVLIEGTGDEARRTRVLLLAPSRRPGASTGIVYREVVVDGWRIEVEIESEQRASLRERATRARGAVQRSGPTPIRAIIPGRIVSVSIVPGDPVEAGQQLLVVEAMKMQNELRAPRAGVVSSVPVGTGSTVEVGDTLVVLE